MKKGTRISLETLRIDWRTHEKTFQPVAAAFEKAGALPPEARAKLVEQVAFAVLDAFFSTVTKQVASPPNKLIAQAKNIIRIVRELHAALATINAPLATKLSHLAPALLAVQKEAEGILCEQQKRLRPRNSRHVGKEPLEGLLHELFDIYDATRSRHPHTGPDIGMNNPLVDFVDAVFEVLNVDPGMDISHLRETIRGALQRWRAPRLAARAARSA